MSRRSTPMGLKVLVVLYVIMTLITLISAGLNASSGMGGAIFLFTTVISLIQLVFLLLLLKGSYIAYVITVVFAGISIVLSLLSFNIFGFIFNTIIVAYLYSIEDYFTS